MASVLPVAELKQAINHNLDRLENCFITDEKRNIRPLLHDLLGFCGLYGMTGLRKIVIEFQASYTTLDNGKNLQEVKRIRQYMNESPILE